MRIVLSISEEAPIHQDRIYPNPLGDQNSGQSKTMVSDLVLSYVDSRTLYCRTLMK